MYTWVQDKYDGIKPLHKLTLVYTIIFNRCLPNICNNMKCIDVSIVQGSIPLMPQHP